MTENFNEIVGKCVVENVVFKGTVGSAYTIQELVHTAKLNTIDSMYKLVSKELKALGEDSLFANSNRAQKANLNLQLDALSAVFDYKREQAAIAKAKEAEKAKRARLLSRIAEAKDEKEIQGLKDMSLEDLEKLESTLV